MSEETVQAGVAVWDLDQISETLAFESDDIVVIETWAERIVMLLASDGLGCVITRFPRHQRKDPWHHKAEPLLDWKNRRCESWAPPKVGQPFEFVIAGLRGRVFRTAKVESIRVTRLVGNSVSEEKEEESS